MGEQRGRPDECTYCGRTFVPNSGVGRPGKYCRRSCRQRAFEQRRHADDQTWSDRRIVELAQRLAVHEDAVDRIRGVVEQLRLDVRDERERDLRELVVDLEDAFRLDRA